MHIKSVVYICSIGKKKRKGYPSCYTHTHTHTLGDDDATADSDVDDAPDYDADERIDDNEVCGGEWKSRRKKGSMRRCYVGDERADEVREG